MIGVGLWPPNVNRALFAFCSVYVALHCAMGACHLIKYLDRLDYVVTNLAENVMFVMMLGKMLVCKRKCGMMARFLEAIQSDFAAGAYGSAREKTAYLRYNETALSLVRILIGLHAVAATLYYFKKAFENWSAKISSNSSLPYQLPYQIYPLFEVEDELTYVCICIYLMIAVPIITCGFAGPDAFILSMVLHICGQFAVLSHKIDDVLKSRENCHIGNIVLKHRQLIELAEILEDSYNLIFLQQTLGTMFLLCLTSYHTIANSQHGADFNLMIIFLLYACCICSASFGYCYIGECLIAESAGLRDTFYNSDWYNRSTSHARLVSICMTRAEKPLMLTAGKFCTLSLNTFTSIVKTSMAYLSMLRNFM